MSLLNKILQFKKQKMHFFTTPSHSQGAFNLPYLKDLYKFDFSEMDGLDNLREPKEVILKMLEKLTKIYDTKQTFALINGSSSGNIASMLTILNQNDKVLITDNCHISVKNGLELTKAHADWFSPTIDEKFNCPVSINKEEVFNKITLPIGIQEALKNKLLKDLKETATFNAGVKSNTTNLLTALKQKEDRLLDFYLEGKLEQSTYDSKKTEIESERKRLLDNIEKYKEIDSKMRDKIINIISIASDLKHVFDIATTSQKSALLKLLLKDCKLNGKTLEYELNKPFDKLLSCPDYKQWPEITINHLDEFDKVVV